MVNRAALPKAQRNNEQKFQYRGIDDVYNALNPRMAEHSVFMVPTVTERKTEERTTKSGNHMSCVTLTVEYRFFHADGSCITCTVMGGNSKPLTTPATPPPMTCHFNPAEQSNA